MAEVQRQAVPGLDLRRHPRHRVSAPFPCAFALLGLNRWTAVERNGLGVVLDVSLKGAKVMSTAAMTPGDHLAVSFRLPDQMAMQFDATVKYRYMYCRMSCLSSMRYLIQAVLATLATTRLTSELSR